MAKKSKKENKKGKGGSDMKKKPMSFDNIEIRGKGFTMGRDDTLVNVETKNETAKKVLTNLTFQFMALGHLDPLGTQAMAAVNEGIQRYKDLMEMSNTAQEVKVDESTIKG